jgi:hypothetical protein
MSDLREQATKVAPVKSNGTDAASPSGGAAARSDIEQVTIEEVVADEVKAEDTKTEPEPKSIEWRGLKFTLPATLPATVGLDMADVEEAVQNIAPIRNMVRSFIGREQFAQVYAKLEEAGDDIDTLSDTLTELISACWEQYGTTLGESEASEPS